MSTTAVVKKPKGAKTVSHPPYFQMIKGALLALNEKSGSSSHAIAKHMEGKHKAVLPPNFRKSLALQLKNSAAKGKLMKIKSSFKLSEAGKKDKASKKKALKGKAVKKPAVKSKTDKKKTNKMNAKVVKTVEAAKPSAPEKKVGIVKKITKTVTKKVSKPAAKKPAKKRLASMAKPKQPKSIKSRASKKAKRAPTKA